MATATLDTNNKWTTSISVTPSLTAVTTATHTFSTAGRYVDRDIKVSATTPKLTSVTVPKDVKFTVNMTADTAADTTSDLTVVNAKNRTVKVIDGADYTGTKTYVTNGGTTYVSPATETNGAIHVKVTKDGSVIGNATNGIQIVGNGQWLTKNASNNTVTNPVTPTASAQGPFYGKVEVAATPAATKGTHTGARATATGTNVTLGTASDSAPSSPYIKITPTAAKYNIATAGWITTGDKTVAAGAVRYYPVTGTTITNSVTKNSVTGYNDPVTTTTKSTSVPQISFTASGTAKAVLTTATSTATYINYFTGNYQYVTT